MRSSLDISPGELGSRDGGGPDDDGRFSSLALRSHGPEKGLRRLRLRKKKATGHIARWLFFGIKACNYSKLIFFKIQSSLDLYFHQKLFNSMSVMN